MISIALDHTRLLGPSIENIAWHKSGIFKSGSLAFSTLQAPAVTAVIQQRAIEKDVTLGFVDIDSSLPTGTSILRLETQAKNCSLALAIVRAWLSKMMSQVPLDAGAMAASKIEQSCLPGRYQRLSEQNCEWFLDGAHTGGSLEYAVQWFASVVSEDEK